MSKILDKIKTVGLSLTSMFKVNDEMDDVSYLDQDSEDGKKLAEAMKPYVDRLNALEAKRAKEQKQLETRIKNSREGDVSEQAKDTEGQVTIENPRTSIIKDGQGMSKDTERKNKKDIDGREI